MKSSGRTAKAVHFSRNRPIFCRCVSLKKRRYTLPRPNVKLCAARKSPKQSAHTLASGGGICIRQRTQKVAWSKPPLTFSNLPHPPRQTIPALQPPPLWQDEPLEETRWRAQSREQGGSCHTINRRLEHAVPITRSGFQRLRRGLAGAATDRYPHTAPLRRVGGHRPHAVERAVLAARCSVRNASRVDTPTRGPASRAALRSR